MPALREESAMSDFDRAVAAHAARQHALITAAQATTLGATPAMIRHRVVTGRWCRVAPGVFRLAGAPVTWPSHVLAAVLAAGPGAVASHRSAGALHALEGCRRGRPEVTLPRGRRYRPAGVRVHESTDLYLADVRRIDGIPTTGVARTLIDLGAVVARAAVHVALDDARRRGLTDWDELLDVMVAHARQGRRGVRALRSIVAEHHDEVEVTDSGGERLIAILLAEAGLPRPELQYVVEENGRTCKIDLAYPAERVAIEHDGRQHTELEIWEDDHPRQNAIVLEGWTVLRYTRRAYLREPDRIVREVRRALNVARAAGRVATAPGSPVGGPA
jgi:hypothetical protein